MRWPETMSFGEVCGKLKFSIQLLMSFIFFALPVTGVVMAAQDTVISGTIHVVWGDPPPGAGRQATQRFNLVDGAGNVIPVIIDKKVLSSVGGVRALQRQRVNVTGSWANNNALNYFTVNSIQFRKKKQTEQAATAPLALVGSQPWVTILCRFGDSPTITPHPKTWFDVLMGNTNPGMDHYWQELSYNNINLAGSMVVGWYDLPDPRSAYLPGGNFDLNKAANDCADAADIDVYFPNFTGINFMFNEDIGCCAWGGSVAINADGGGGYSATWMPPWGYEAHGVLAQEMGHGFGLPHSSGPYSTPYDSYWDPMSDGGLGYISNGCPNIDPDYGCIGVHTISYHKDIMGWLPPSRRYYAPPGTSQQTITIERLGQPTNSTDYLMATIPIAGTNTQFYTVEARRGAGGYDANIPGDAVIIHKVNTTLGDRNAQVVDDTLNDDPNDAGAMWTAGETFTDAANGISVSIDADAGTGYVVTINNNGEPLTYCPSALTPSFVFQDNLENTASGNWVNTVASGINHWSGGAGTPDIYYSWNSYSGTYSFFGNDYDVVGDSSVEMTNDILLPSNAYMLFQSDFDMEVTYDGGVVEYSTDGGLNWLDAGDLIDAGQGYTDVLDTGFSNPLGGRLAFTGSTGGYIGTRLNLGALVGQNIRFRFRIGTDNSVPGVGWYVDDIEIYQCGTHTQLPIIDPVGDKGVVEGNSLVFYVYANDPDGGPPPVLSATGLPPSASFTDNGDGSGTFVWSTAPGDASASPYSVTFIATDASDATLVDSETISIKVNVPFAYCPAPQSPAFLFQDDLENTSSGDWENMVFTGINHWNGGAGSPDIYFTGNPDSGVYSFFGNDYNSVGDSTIQMTRDITLPSDAFMHFQGDFNLEDIFDGGVVEYSTDGGLTWLDAGGLIDAGQGYAAVLNTNFSNPLGGRMAFTGSSGGYIGSRLNLGALTGQNIRFRFRMGTDSSVPGLGWYVDNIEVYRCVTHTLPPILATVGDKSVVEGSTLSFNITASDPDGGPPPLLSATGLPSAASFTDNGDGSGTFTWPTSLGDAAASPYPVTFTATDAAEATLMDAETINITVLSDTDADGIPDANDNCTLQPNPSQRDTDGDGFGNWCDPDFDNNGIVNAADLAFFKTKFFTTDPDPDLTGDGIVNAADLAILKAFFFKAPGPSGL